VAGISPNIARRRYVSATTKDSAQVNVDTAIRADHKAFFAETGKLPENEIIPGTSTSADAMMSPMAGTQWSMEEFNRGLRFCRCT